MLMLTMSFAHSVSAEQRHVFRDIARLHRCIGNWGGMAKDESMDLCACQAVGGTKCRPNEHYPHLQMHTPSRNSPCTRGCTPPRSEGFQPRRVCPVGGILRSCGDLMRPRVEAAACKDVLGDLPRQSNRVSQTSAVVSGRFREKSKCPTLTLLRGFSMGPCCRAEYSSIPARLTELCPGIHSP